MKETLAIFDAATGEVRLANNQLVFRLSTSGIVVWNKKSQEEELIPWLRILAWALSLAQA